jgi:hypothetical protein
VAPLLLPRLLLASWLPLELELELELAMSHSCRT